MGVKHHHTARRSLVLQHRLTQTLVGKVLHLAVNAQLQIFAFNRRNQLANAFDHMPLTIFNDTACAVFTAQVRVECQLHAFLSGVLHIGEAHHMRGRLALWVHAFVFHGGVDAMDAQLFDFFARALIYLTSQPDMFAACIADFLFQLGQWHVQQLRQVFQL